VEEKERDFAGQDLCDPEPCPEEKPAKNGLKIFSNLIRNFF